jgi:DNA-binding NarL/FixJ family response regulator
MSGIPPTVARMKLASTNKRNPELQPGLNGSEAKRKFRVIIADESPLCLMGLRVFLDEDERFEIIAEAENGEEALQAILEHQPDVAVLDGSLPGISGFEVAGLLKARDCAVNLVIFAAQKDEQLFNQAISLGIRGYLLKRNSAAEVLNCVAAVASGEAYVSPLLTDFLLRRRSRADALGRQQPGLGQLTITERRILQRIALGRTSRQIAMECGISPRTVDSHRAHICEKLGLSGSNRLLQFALEHRDALTLLD